MNRLPDTEWFTEVCKEGGSAFSLKLGKKVHVEKTRYQLIEIYETEHFGKLMVIDGFVMLTSLDNFLYHEMMAHPVLFTHPDPKQVVIIGGGDCGTLREVLQHDRVEHALQVEIDERVTRLAETWFPELCEANDDPRADFLFGDGIRWVQEAEPGSVDVIIVDSTDPIGPAEGLFSEAFYRDCHIALGEQGLLIQQSESPLFHLDSIIRPMHQAMRAAGFSHTHSLQFPQPCYPSGWWTATMAGKQTLMKFRENDAVEKSFKTRYYNAGIHRASLSTPELMLHLINPDQRHDQ